MANRVQPYACFSELEAEIGVPTVPGMHPKERAMRMWKVLMDFWGLQRTQVQQREQVALLRRCLKIAMGAVLDPAYAVSSRARWLCSFKTSVLFQEVCKGFIFVESFIYFRALAYTFIYFRALTYRNRIRR